MVASPHIGLCRSMAAILTDVISGVWATGFLAAIWYVKTRPSPPIAESQEDRDLRDWLDGQL